MAGGEIGTCDEAERMSRYSPARVLSRTRLRMTAREASSEKVNLSVKPSFQMYKYTYIYSRL